MQNLSSQVDIERAKRELSTRRTDTLKRHADELRLLDIEQAEIDTLEKLLVSFSQKFGTGSGDAVEPPAVPAAPVVPPPAPEPARPQRSKYQQTNFEIFSRAASFGTF